MVNAKMILVVVMIAFAAGTANANFFNYLIGFDPECTFTRHDAVDCIGRYIDTNRDRIVTIAEIDAARDRYTGILLKMIERVVSWKIDISTKKIVQDCGGRPDGTFTEEAFLHSKTCMPSQYALCLFRVACKHAESAGPPPAGAGPNPLPPPRLKTH